MQFITEIYHPNGLPFLLQFFSNCRSFQKWWSLHIHPTPSGRGSLWARASLWTLAPYSYRDHDCPERHFDVVGPQWPFTRECGGCCMFFDLAKFNNHCLLEIVWHIVYYVMFFSPSVSVVNSSVITSSLLTAFRRTGVRIPTCSRRKCNDAFAEVKNPFERWWFFALLCCTYGLLSQTFHDFFMDQDIFWHLASLWVIFWSS